MLNLARMCDGTTSSSVNLVLVPDRLERMRARHVVTDAPAVLSAAATARPLSIDSTNPRGIRMTEVAALNRDIAKQHPENVFQSPLEIVDEILLTKGEKLGTLKRWQLSILGDLATSGEGIGSPDHVPGQLRGQLTVLEEIEEAKVLIGKDPLPN
jgi:hypothetical protein